MCKNMLIINKYTLSQGGWLKYKFEKMQITRRNFITSSLAYGMSATSSMAGSSNLENLKPIVTPELRLINAHTKERLFCKFHDGAAYIDMNLRRLDWFFRDWRQGEKKNMDRDLYWALAVLREAVMQGDHSGEIEIISGYRSEKTNQMLRRRSSGVARNSLHLKAMAVDFKFPGVPVRDIFNYAEWMGFGGVGHYPNSFVHIDTGRQRSWGV